MTIDDIVQPKLLSLCKGEESFFIRYLPGDEAAVVDAIIEWVRRPDLAFDWFDAAIISHALGQQMGKALSHFLTKDVH